MHCLMLGDMGKPILYVLWLCLPAEGMGWPDGRSDLESLPLRSWFELPRAGDIICLSVSLCSCWG